MVLLINEIHFWTTQEDVIIKYSDYGSFKYYNKKETSDGTLYQSKKLYCEQRNVLWHLPNKRPNRLKDKLKELEDYLIQNKIIHYLWIGNKLQLLLSTGLIVNITTNEETGDISNIIFEKQLSTKLQVNIICDGVILGQQVICVCNDGHVLGHGRPWKEGWLLEGGPRRRLNCHGEWLVVWGKAGSEHPQPWSPLTKDHQRANVHLYWVGARGPELLAYKNTDGEPLNLLVSKVHERSLVLVEQKVTSRGAVSVEISALELNGNTLKTVSITSVPLQTHVSCSALSPNEDHLLVGCIDGTLALLDRHKGSTKTTKAAFIATMAVWHPDGAVVAISNDRGQIQYYDAALNCVKSQILGEDSMPNALIDLSGYPTSQFTVVSLSWGPKDVVLALEQGPMVLLRHAPISLSFMALAQNYLRVNDAEKAIALLLSWKFGESAYVLLQKIVTHLLRRPLTPEVATMLQNALGCYHAPAVPISVELKHQFGSQVYALTRRFFHQLVRTEMYETAFLLAVDLGQHDLFMDLHYIAVKIGETEMAAAARAQASALVSRCSSEASNCSRSSCSQCSTSDSEEKTLKTPATNALESLSVNNDFLSTNFNQDNPKTYNQTLPLPPRGTFVRSPQVPANFTPTAGVIRPPPLPFTSPLPSLLNSNLGIPLVEADDFSGGVLSTKPPLPVVPLNNPFVFTNKSTRFVNRTLGNNNFVRPPNRNVPPLPNAPPPFSQSSTSFLPPVLPPTMTNLPPNSNLKKPQPKVKFSDTVTAFIVPEIKRPVRPPPPSHVTDPQKELADSLPLCHPNEDYLKDFAPVQKNDGEPAEASAQAPKIKVVHFGIV